MSFQAMTWAGEQRAGGPSAKATLFAIANYANEHDVAWPRQELLAEQSEQSVDSVGRRLKELAEKGLLRRIPLRFAGRKTVDFIILARSRFYRAPIEEIEELLPRGCTVAGDGDAPADCGNADPVTLPQTLPQSAADAPAMVREQEPVMEPREQIEREARARDSRNHDQSTEPTGAPATSARGSAADAPASDRRPNGVEEKPDPETDQDFQALLVKVARVAGPQPVGRCFGKWRRLLGEERQAALDGWESCLAEWSRGGRSHPYGLETYLNDRMWMQAPKLAGGAVPRVVLALRSGEWFAAFWARWVARDLKGCQDMLRLGKAGSGFGVEASATPAPEVIEAMPRVDARGAEWAAWRRKLAADGLMFGEIMVPAWVWVPSKVPFEAAKQGAILTCQSG